MSELLSPPTVLSAIAILFGTLWTVVNLYQFYPVIQSRILSLATWTYTTDAVFHAPDATLNSLTEQAMQDGDRNSMPTIDIYIPAYREEDVIHQAIKSVCETTYPNELLNLYVLLEPDDEPTRAVVNELAEQYPLSIIVVPEGYPGTPNKPRALNYAFEQTDGEIVGVIDAENIVEPDLFDRVAAAIVDEERDYVQGLVDMANESDGWLNLLFRAEYGFWYRLIVPAFRRVNFPIPLSGTTCFFRRTVLEQASAERYRRTGAPWGDYPLQHHPKLDVRDDKAPLSETTSDTEPATDGGHRTTDERGGREWLAVNGLSGFIPWDPTNVTEDFELGLLLWAREFDFGLVQSITREESPRSVSTWLKQRTRWQKGKIYTFLIFLREGIDDTQKQSHILWQSFLPHLGPVNILGLLFLVAFGIFISYTPEYAIVKGVLALSLSFLIMGVLAYMVGYWFASTEPIRRRVGRVGIVLLTVPGYWFLQWIADVRAGKQLLSGNLSWEKTMHENAGRFDDLRHLGTESDRSIWGLARSYLTADLRLYPVLVAAFLLRLPGLTESLWLDETYSVVVRGSRSVIGVIMTQGPHPPLYFLLLKGWMTVFGTGEVAVRMMSVVFGVLTVVAGYVFATQLYDRKTGLIFAGILAVSRFQVQYSQTVRMYSLLIFLSFLSLYFYMRVLDSPTFENRFWYGVMTFALLMTHTFGGFVVLAELLYLAVYLWTYRDEGYASGLSVLKTDIVVGILVLPWAVGIMVLNVIFDTNSEAVSWLQTPDLTTLRHILYSYTNVPINYPRVSVTHLSLVAANVLLGMFVLFCGYLLVRFIYKLSSDGSSENTDADSSPILANIRRRMIADPSPVNGVQLGIILLVATTAVPYLISRTVIPIIASETPRYAISGFIGFALVFARGIATLPRQKLTVISVIVMLCLSLPGLVSYYQTSTSEDWEGLTMTLNEADLSDDLIVYAPEYTKDPVSYYMTNESEQEVTSTEFVNRSHLREVTSNSSFKHIWIVTFNDTNTSFTSVLRPRYQQATVKHYGSLKLIKYTTTQNETSSDQRSEQRPPALHERDTVASQFNP